MEARQIVRDILEHGAPKARFFNDTRAQRHMAFAAELTDDDLRAAWRDMRAGILADWLRKDCGPWGQRFDKPLKGVAR